MKKEGDEFETFETEEDYREMRHEMLYQWVRKLREYGHCGYSTRTVGEFTSRVDQVNSEMDGSKATTAVSAIATPAGSCGVAADGTEGCLNLKGSISSVCDLGIGTED